MILLNSPTFNLVSRSLDAASTRHQVISNNVSNADTPYFKRAEVRFEELLQNELSTPFSIRGFRTDPRHFVIGPPAEPRPQVVTDGTSTMNNNMNNVDIDLEMSLLAKNQLNYNVLTQQINHEIKMARSAMGVSN